MTFIKTLTLELVPALLAALVAGMGAYMAIKDDMTTLQVNQGYIIAGQQEMRKEYKEIRKEQYEQGARLALMERYARVD